MKKILRLVTTSVLTLTLVACGEASSSVSSSNTGNGSVSSVSSAYANVTSVTLSAATATLTQVLGAQSRVTVTAALNANTNPNITLEWFVNGVKQAQISRIFDFTPTEAGSFAITVRVGNLTSNTLTVTATSPVFVAKETSFKKANLIEIVADGGFNVSLVGATLDASSYYSIEDGKYVLNLSEPVVQGTVVNVRFEKQGFATTVVPVTFDTRTLSLDEFEVENAVSAGFVAIPAVAGVYQVVKPFEATAAFNKTYRISMLNKNVIPEVGTTSLSIQTTVPTGATAVPLLTKLVSTLADETFTVTKDTVAGLYTHKISVGGRTLEVKVQVLEATPEIVVNQSKYTYVDNVTGNNLPYAVQLNRNITVDTLGTSSADSFLSPGEKVPVSLNAAGEFVVEKQNETFYSTANFDVIEFEFIARHFAKSDFVTNQFAVALFGPTEFAAREQLFSGMATKNPLTGAVDTRYNVWDLLNDGTDDNDISNNSILSFGTNFSVADTQGTSNTSHKGTLYQFIDAATLPGLYTFVITAGPLGAQLTREVKVRVVEPTARLDFVPVSFTSNHSITGPITATRNHALTSTAPNVFEIEKPVASGDTYLLDWAIVLSNYQSKIVTDFQTISADQALTAQNRKLFAKTSGIKLTDNDKLIPFVSVDTPITLSLTDVPVPATALSYSVSTTKSGNGIAFAGASPQTTGTNSINIPTGSGVYSLGGVTLTPTAIEGESATVVITFYSAASAAISGLSAATLANPVTVRLYVSGYADVVEFGGQTFADQTEFGNDTYSLVNFSLQTSGPNTTTFPKVDLTRTAIRMSPLSSGLAIYERSAVANRKTRIDAALTAALKAEKALSYSAFDGANTYFYNLETVATPSVYSSTATEITSLTPVGTFTLTMMVDQLVRTITIIVKNPTTKVSVLSVTEDALTGGVFLANDYKNTSGIHTLAASSNFTLGAAASSRLRVLGTAGTSVASTSFVAPVNGVYTVALSAVTPDKLLGFVAVNDLAIGSYTYNISKKYPDGRVVTFNDIATVTGHDDNGLALFGSVTGDSIKSAANTIFNTNWIINETGALLKGQYVYEFTINGVTRKAEVNVLDSVGLDITNVSIDGNNMTKFGNGFLVTLANAIGSLEIEFDLNLVTNENYVRVLSYSSASGSVVTPAKWLTNNTIADTVYTKLSDLDGSLKLANLASGTSPNQAASLETLFIVIEIYSVVPFSSADTIVLANVGKLRLVSSQTLKLRIDALA
jgi:hypothetical protein